MKTILLLLGLVLTNNSFAKNKFDNFDHGDWIKGYGQAATTIGEMDILHPCKMEVITFNNELTAVIKIQNKFERWNVESVVRYDYEQFRTRDIEEYNKTESGETYKLDLLSEPGPFGQHLVLTFRKNKRGLGSKLLEMKTFANHPTLASVDCRRKNSRLEDY